MPKFIKMTGMLIFVLAALTGCDNQTQQMTEQIANLKAEVVSLSNKLDESNKKLKEQEAVNELRNVLDNNLHMLLRTLIQGDLKAVEGRMASNVRIENNRLYFKENGVENDFIIPDRQMNLRQRTFMMQGDSYSAIYEIYDAGYTTGTRYDDRIYSLHVGYVLEQGMWKLSEMDIDE